MNGDACQHERDGGFRAVMVRRKSRIHAGFRGCANARCVQTAEPQRGPAVKSRTKAHRAKCKKSLSGNIFGAANESLFGVRREKAVINRARAPARQRSRMERSVIRDSREASMPSRISLRSIRATLAITPGQSAKLSKRVVQSTLTLFFPNTISSSRSRSPFIRWNVFGLIN